MDLKASDYVTITLLLGLLVISFCAGAFLSRFQLNDVMETQKLYCLNQSQNGQNFDFGNVIIEAINYDENQLQFTQKRGINSTS